MEITEIKTKDEEARDFRIDGLLTLHIKKNDCGYSFDIMNDLGEVLYETAVDVEVNKFGVPYRTYEVALADGTSRVVDIGCEDEWGDIQSCNPEDCEDWENSIGIGNDCDGHKKIVWVEGWGDRVKEWYDKCVAVWADKYSD